MQTCYTYDSTTKRLEVAKNYGMIDGAAVINPTREQCARMTPPAYPLGTSTPPEPPEGKIAVPDGYELVPSEPDGYVPGIEPEDLALMEWRQKWRYEDAPPPPPRTFSKLKLYAALAQAGLWDALVAWLNTQTFEGINAYTAFMLAQDLVEDHPMFAQWLAAAKTALGVTDEQVEAILATAAE